MVTKQDVITILKTIPDPELNVSIWDLGLVYTVAIAKGKVEITMTLTSVGCPLFSTIETTLKEALMNIPGVTEVTVELTFEPPWTMDRMSEEARMQLGM